MKNENLKKLEEVAEANSSFSSSPSSILSPLWLDLPDALTELILERLPLLSYLRFAAVCPKWRDIQRRHRLRHSSRPPPMAPSPPWIISSARGRRVEFFSVSDLVLHRSPFPAQLDAGYCCGGTSHGWIFMCKGSRLGRLAVSLFNPVSGDLIHLPAVATRPTFTPDNAFLSSPPYEPNCIAFLQVSDKIHICQVGCSSQWTTIENIGSDARWKFFGGSSGISCGGKFYLLHYWFKVVDPLSPAPTTEILEMDCSHLPEKIHQGYLLEWKTEVFLVVALRRPEIELDCEFQVFVADIANKKWLRVHSLGDRVFFLCYKGSFSTSAADVGCKSNSIFYTDGIFGCRCDRASPAWKIYDLESKKWTRGSPLSREFSEQDPFCAIWFVPSLDHLNAGNLEVYQDPPQEAAQHLLRLATQKEEEKDPALHTGI